MGDEKGRKKEKEKDITRKRLTIKKERNKENTNKED
jgi:hypothetical protein